MILNESQVAHVAAYLKTSGIENRQVFSDLLDHLCCMIEKEMDCGLSFDDALRTVIRILPGVEMKSIELFTLKLIHMETTFSSRTALLATIPFVLFGLGWALMDSGLSVPYFIKSLLLLASILSMFVLFGIGWTYNFPRWSIPAIGFCILFSLFFTMVRIPAISEERLGVWALIPMLVTCIICIICRMSFGPVKQLIKKIKDEPALVLFALYGFAPLFVSLFMDEMHTWWNVPVVLTSTAVLVLGLYLFLRSGRRKVRLISILSSAVVAMLITYTASIVYWS